MERRCLVRITLKKITLENNYQMKLLQRSMVRSVIALALTMVLMGQAICGEDERTVSQSSDKFEAWIDGLNDSSYRVRRESFLRLCDRDVPLDAWLDAEFKSGDKHRAAMATWLKRLRRPNGSLSDRIKMLGDYEILRAPDDSSLDKFGVLQRYMADGRWEALLELLSLLDAPVRNELLMDDGKMEIIIDHAWKSDHESVVPRLLDMVLKPIDRVRANRLWKSLGLPNEWQVSQNRDLPSVKVVELEADGKIDEAILLAEKSVLRYLVEPILIRSDRWDKWLTLESRRTPIADAANFAHQRIGIMIMLGRMDEANELLDTIRIGNQEPDFLKSNAALSLALGRADEFDAYLAQQSDTTSFHVMRGLGRVRGAFERVGLPDLSVDSVQTWLDKKGYQKHRTAEDSEPQRNLKHLPLAEYASLLFQVGLSEQGNLVESYLVAAIRKQELVEEVTAWIPFWKQWVLTNQRDKAIYYWKDYLIRNSGKTKAKHGVVHTVESEQNPFEYIYSDFPFSAALMFDHLVSVASNIDADSAGDALKLSKDERRSNAIELAIEQMEDLHAGRRPSRLKDQNSLLSLRKAVYQKSQLDENPDRILAEFAVLFDSLGETKLAIETLEMGKTSTEANQDKARYLKRLGLWDAACDILMDEYQNDASNLALLVDCDETLETIGRLGARDRFRMQAFSSVSNDWTATDKGIVFPPSKIVQAVMEQLWLRDGIEKISGINAALCLSRQLGDAAESDMPQTKQAAKYARIAGLLWIKKEWRSPTRDVGRSLSVFGSVFQSLILDAIADENRDLADKLFEVAYQCKPYDIDVPIIVVPIAERVFGKDFADRWFDRFYKPMLNHLEEFPDDTLIGNNTAWLAAKCDRHLEKAQSLASKVAVSHPDPTYLDTLAEIEYRLGHIDRAIELSERCLQIEPKNKQHREQLKRFRAGKP